MLTYFCCWIRRVLSVGYCISRWSWTNFIVDLRRKFWTAGWLILVESNFDFLNFAPFRPPYPLDPLLFFIYVNDIYCCSQIFQFYLFADDTNLLYLNKDLKDLEKVVNDELAKVGDWLDANKRSLNTSRSNFVISHPYQHNPDCIIPLEIYNNDFKKWQARIRNCRNLTVLFVYSAATS